MPYSYVSNLVHYIFSTKERLPFIDQELESRLWPYMGGIARENGMKALAIGGTADQRRVVKMGSRSIARVSEVRVARWVRRVQR